MTQATLFAPISRQDQLRANWEAFHRAHPEVFQLFEKFALEKIAEGRVYYSADCVMHRVRWETGAGDKGRDEFKINDHHVAFYARLFLTKWPEHDGFFRTRVQTSSARRAR